VAEGISCRYIGHATAILRAGPSVIITDPHFGKRTLVFPRVAELPIDPSELPDLSCVLLSHTHFDHLDISSYKYISCAVPIIVPEGSERAIGRYMPNPVIELSHYAEHELADGTKIMAVPLAHRSSRLSHLRFKKTNGYIVWREGAGRIFFCADSAYSPLFREIGNLGKIDLALLPIGGYSPRWPMLRCHMSPSEAVQAFEDLRAAHMVPIHYGTFRLSLEPVDEPARILREIVAARQDLSGRIHILSHGESFSIEQG